MKKKTISYAVLSGASGLDDSMVECQSVRPHLILLFEAALNFIHHRKAVAYDSLESVRKINQHRPR